jgi:hypothetical protein
MGPEIPDKLYRQYFNFWFIILFSIAFSLIFKYFHIRFPPWLPGFDPKLGYVRFVVDECHWGRFPCEVHLFPLSALITLTADTLTVSSNNKLKKKSPGKLKTLYLFHPKRCTYYIFFKVIKFF